MTDDTELLGLYRQARADVERLFGEINLSEDEVAQAIARHPAAADLFFHSFDVIAPTRGMDSDFVARGHARELLDRLAAGADTRPGTAAEVVLVCSRASLTAPLLPAAAGLYMRMWAAAFPDHPHTAEQADTLAHHEALDGSDMDTFERDARRKLANPGRRIRDVECDGDHHGIQVDCRYAQQPAAQVPRPRRGRQEEALF